MANPVQIETGPPPSATADAPAGRPIVATVLVVACVLVSAWLLLSHFATRRVASLNFAVTQSTFASFTPRDATWRMESAALRRSDEEPNIMAMRMSLPGRDPVTVRVALGYNMPECMQIKGFATDLVSDEVGQAGCQTWRIHNDTGETQIWITTMLSAEDLSAAGVDIRSMRFPRVGIPDDPNWKPEGISLSGLRHPIRNIRLYLRSRWNASRCDLLTFLRLRRPAYVSDKILTFVACTDRAFRYPEDEAERIRYVRKSHDVALAHLREWWPDRAGQPNQKEVDHP